MGSCCITGHLRAFTTPAQVIISRIFRICRRRSHIRSGSAGSFISISYARQSTVSPDDSHFRTLWCSVYHSTSCGYPSLVHFTSQSTTLRTVHCFLYRKGVCVCCGRVAACAETIRCSSATNRFSITLSFAWRVMRDIARVARVSLADSHQSLIRSAHQRRHSSFAEVIPSLCCRLNPHGRSLIIQISLLLPIPSAFIVSCADDTLPYQFDSFPHAQRDDMRVCA